MHTKNKVHPNFKFIFKFDSEKIYSISLKCDKFQGPYKRTLITALLFYLGGAPVDNAAVDAAAVEEE